MNLPRPSVHAILPGLCVAAFGTLVCLTGCPHRALPVDPALVPFAAVTSEAGTNGANILSIQSAGTVNNYQGGILTPKAREDLLRLTADQDARLKEMMKK